MGLVVQSSIDPLALLDGFSISAPAGEAADGDVFTSLLSSLLGENNAAPAPAGAPAAGSTAATASTGELRLESADEEPGKRPASDWAAAIALAFVPSPLIKPAPSVDRPMSSGGGGLGAPALEPAAGSQAPLGAGPAATAINLTADATSAAPAAAPAPAEPTSEPLAPATTSPATTGSDTEIPLDWVPQPQTSGDQDPVDLPVVPLSTVGIGSGEQPALEVLHPELFQPHNSATSAWETTPDTEPAEAPQQSAPPPNTENVVTPGPAPAPVEPDPADAPPVDDSTPATPAPQGPPPTEAEFAASPNQVREAAATTAVVPAMEARPPRVRGKANVEHQLAERERANAVRGLTVGDPAQAPGVVRFAGNTETAPANVATKAEPNASNVARERVAETPAVSHSAVTAGMPANRGIESSSAEAPAAPAPIHTELPPAVHQVSRAIIERAEAGGGEARLHLDPAGMGEVTIHVETRGDEVHVDIQAERPEAMHLLRDHAVDLSSLLGERGLNLTDVSVGSQQRHAAGEGLFRDSRRNRRDNDNFAALLGIEEGPSTERHNRLRSAYNPDGALSYRV